MIYRETSGIKWSESNSDGLQTKSFMYDIHGHVIIYLKHQLSLLTVKKISLYILRAGRSTTQLCMSAANFQSTKAKGSRFSWRSTAQMERHYAGYNCMNHRLDSEREIGSIKRLRSQRSPYIPWSHILMVAGITQRARRCREVESNPTQEIFKIHRANSHWLRNFRMQKPTKNTTQLGMACNCC